MTRRTLVELGAQGLQHSPAPRLPAGWVPPSAKSASWHQGGGLAGQPTATLSPAPTLRPGLRRRHELL